MTRPIGVVLVAAALLASACGGSSSEPGDYGPAAGQGVVVVTSPSDAAVLPGAKLKFSAQVTGTADTAVSWSVTDSNGGTVDATGLYTAPSVEGTFHVRATTVDSSGTSATSAVHVMLNPPPQSVAVAIDPTTATVSAGGPVSFAAAVTGTTTRSVTWTVQEGSNCGSVSTLGVYTAPAAGTTCHVVATSVADVSKSATATVTVSVSSGGSDLSGTITTRTLTLAGSPYRVTGDVSVPAGNRLTIEPGVHLVFQGHFKISIAGRITARGTAAQKILFTHKDGTNTQGHNGIRFPANTSLVDGMGDVFEYCIVEYGRKNGMDGAGPDGAYSEVAGGGIYLCARDNWAFNNNEIRDNVASEWGGGITLIAQSGSFTMTGNNVHDNVNLGGGKGYGGGMWIGHANPNYTTVIGGAFRNNTTTANGGGISLIESSARFDSIAMSGNYVGGTLNDYGKDSSTTLTLVNTPSGP
jgi:hypothetical protein